MGEEWGGGLSTLGLDGQPPRQRRMMMMSAAGRDVVPAEDKDRMNGLKPYQIRHYSCTVRYLHCKIVFSQCLLVTLKERVHFYVT